MQIPSGNNFGNRLPNLKQTNIANVGGGVGKAMSGAFSAVTGAIDKKLEDIEANAMVDAGNATLAYQRSIDKVYSGISKDLNDGVIGIEDIDSEREKRVSELGEPPPIKGLSALGQKKLGASYNQVRYKNEVNINSLRETGRIKKAENSFLTRVDELKEQALSKEANIVNIKLMAVDENLNKTGQVAYGLGWERKRQEILYGLDLNYIQGQINQSVDSKDTKSLQDLKTSLLDSEQYKGLKALDRRKFIQTIEPIININVGISYGKSLSEGITKPIERTGNFEASNTFSAMQLEYSKLYSSENTDNSKTSENSTIGFAQITAEMAKEAAEKSGEPFDEQRFNTDTQYHLQLSQATYQYYLEEYGSPMMAVAAYTVGKEEMNKWIQSAGDPRRNETTEKDFIKKAPNPKAKKLVTNVANHVANKDQNILDAEAAIANIDNNPNLNKDQKSYAKEEIAKDLKEIQKVYKTNYESLWRDIFINQIPLSEIDPTQLAKLNYKDQQQLTIYKKQPQLDLRVLSQVRGRLKAGEELNILKEYGNKLPANKLDALLTMQQELTNNPQKQEKLTTTAAFIQDRCKKLDITDTKAKHELIDTVSDEIEQAQIAKKSKLTKQEMLDITDKHLVPVRHELALSEYKTLISEQQTPKANKDSIQIKDVPQDIRDQIIPLLKQNNLPVTNENIIKCYKGIRNGQ